MMNMQSMNQGFAEPAQEMVMPTNTSISEPQTSFGQTTPAGFGEPLPAHETQSMNSFGQFNPNPIENNNFNINNEFNPMNNFATLENNHMMTGPALNNEPSLYGSQEPQTSFGPTSPADFGLQPNISETSSIPMTDKPLFNPDVVMPNEIEANNNFIPFSANNEMNSFQEPQYNQSMDAPNFEVPVMHMEPVVTPSVDKLSELQSLLNANGYNYKLFSNETDNCIIIEIPKY